MYLKMGFYFIKITVSLLVLQADTKFYQNQTKVHPPDGMIKPQVSLGPTKR
jgi:hypothetical protein